MATVTRAIASGCLILGALALTESSAAQARCAGEIAQFRAIIDSDAQTGNLNRSVYRRMQPELRQAASACRSGRDGEALRELHSVKARYGYH